MCAGCRAFRNLIINRLPTRPDFFAALPFPNPVVNRCRVRDKNRDYLRAQTSQFFRRRAARSGNRMDCRKLRFLPVQTDNIRALRKLDQTALEIYRLALLVFVKTALHRTAHYKCRTADGDVSKTWRGLGKIMQSAVCGETKCSNRIHIKKKKTIFDWQQQKRFHLTHFTFSIPKHSQLKSQYIQSEPCALQTSRYVFQAP